MSDNDAENGELHRRLATLRGEQGTEYLEKDLLKAIGATSLIGEGGTGSSTERYVAAAGNLANVEDYLRTSRVFVSANGARPGRVPVVNKDGLLNGAYKSLSKVIAVGAVVVADTDEFRDDQYNIGERELAGWLETNGYREASVGSGFWIPQGATHWWEECRTAPTVSPATGLQLNSGSLFYHCPATSKSLWSGSVLDDAPIVRRDPRLPCPPIPPPLGHDRLEADSIRSAVTTTHQ
jgi:hypothetical protein